MTTDRSKLILLYRGQLQLCRRYFPGLIWRRREWGLEGTLKETEYRLTLKENDWGKSVIGWYGMLSIGMAVPCISPPLSGLTLEDCLQFISQQYAYEQNLRIYLLTGDRSMIQPFQYVLFHLYSNADQGWLSYPWFVNNEGAAWDYKSLAKLHIHYGQKGDDNWKKLCSKLKEQSTKMIPVDIRKRVPN